MLQRSRLYMLLMLPVILNIAVAADPVFPSEVVPVRWAFCYF